MSKDKFRVSFGMSIGDTVPLWGRGSSTYSSCRGKPLRRWFYCWANRPSEHSYGGVGFKAGFIFVRIVCGRSG